MFPFFTPSLKRPLQKKPSGGVFGRKSGDLIDERHVQKYTGTSYVVIHIYVHMHVLIKIAL